MRINRKVLLATVIAVVTSVSSMAATIYVNHAATGLDDGSSWSNAYVDLQSALSSAVSGDEIWVAKGTYYPGNGQSDRFGLVSNVSIFGHFDATETLLN